MERGLPQSYVDYLQSLPSYTPPPLHWLHHLCAIRMFLCFWHPILSFTMKRVKAKADASPEWAAVAVNLLFRTMWFHHDVIHRKLWLCDGGTTSGY